VENHFYFNHVHVDKPRKGKIAPMVHMIFSSWDLDVQQGMFKLNMKKMQFKHAKSHGPCI
jgi:hypothetical protein